VQSEVEDLLKAANDASAQVRALWLAYIALGAYLLVTVGGTTHKQLLLDQPTELPLLGVHLPLKAFFQIVPVLFVLVHAYVLVQLYLLSRTLHFLKASIEDNIKIRSDRERLRTRIDSFVVTQLILVTSRSWLTQSFLRVTAWLTLLVAPILLLLIFQVQFLAYHDVSTTWVHRVAVIADLLLVWLLWPAVIHPSGRFGGALSALVYGTVTRLLGVWTMASGLIERLRGEGIRWDDIRPALRTAWAGFELQDAIYDILRQFAGLAVLVVTCGLVIGFSVFIATIPGEWIERHWTEGMQAFSADQLPEECKAILGEPRSAADPTSGKRTPMVWELRIVDADLFKATVSSPTLACLSNPLLWQASTSLSAASRSGRVRQAGTWWPTAILFEGAPDQVHSVARSWFARNIVLTYAYLTDLDAEQIKKVEHTIILRGRDLRYAALDASDLRKVDLSDAELEGATLGRSDLRNANLTEANLAGADLFGARLGEANLSEAKLRYAELREVDAPGAHFDHADLEGAKLSDANLPDASFTGATMNNVEMRGTKLKNTDFNGAALIGASFLNAHLQSSKFRAADLYGAGFDDADLQGASFGLSNLEGASLSNVHAEGAQFDNAHMQAAQLGGAQLLGASFHYTELQAASLTGVNAVGASFNYAHLEGANFEHAQLRGADLRDAKLWRATIDDANFASTDVRRVDTTKPSPAPETTIADWLKSIPSGDARDQAQRQLARLADPLSPDPGTAMNNIWSALAQCGWDEAATRAAAGSADPRCALDPGRDDDSLAVLLTSLACRPSGNSLYVAAGLADRIIYEWPLEPKRTVFGKVAKHLLSNECAGAKGLSADQIAQLKQLLPASAAAN